MSGEMLYFYSSDKYDLEYPLDFVEAMQALKSGKVVESDPRLANGITYQLQGGHIWGGESVKVSLDTLWTKKWRIVPEAETVQQSAQIPVENPEVAEQVIYANVN
jgi:hypothetical protein